MENERTNMGPLNSVSISFSSFFLPYLCLICKPTCSKKMTTRRPVHFTKQDLMIPYVVLYHWVSGSLLQVPQPRAVSPSDYGGIFLPLDSCVQYVTKKKRVHRIREKESYWSCLQSRPSASLGFSLRCKPRPFRANCELLGTTVSMHGWW